MKCPICQHGELRMTVREGVEIDYCPTCRGVWLDWGELDTIITRTMAAVDPSLYDDDHDRHGKYDRFRRAYDGDFHGPTKRKASPKTTHKKHRSFLSELLDFDF